MSFLTQLLKSALGVVGISDGTNVLGVNADGSLNVVTLSGDVVTITDPALVAALIAQGTATAGVKGLTVFCAVYSATPTYTAGKSDVPSLDLSGNLLVKPYRRSQTVAAGTACTTTAATTVLAAQDGFFTDITHLFISPLAVAIDVNFTVTLSDGTNSYTYNLNTGAVTTPAPGTQVAITFDPPLPASSISTAWTLTMSVTETVNVNIVAVLQKGN